MTLSPVSGDRGTTLCIVCGPTAGTDMIMNLALFLPLGAALALLGASWRTALACGLGATLIIEMLQLMLPIGRVASVSDVVMNLLGTAIGFQLASNRRRILYPRSPSSMRFLIVGSIAWLAILGLTALGMRPSHPRGQYIGQFSPDVEDFDRHGGRVQAARLSGFDLPDGPLPNTDAVRAAMRTRTQLDVTAQFVTHRGRLAPVVRVVDAADREVALLAQRQQDLLFRTRVLASNLRLVTPAVIMFDPLASVDLANGLTMVVDAERRGGHLRMSAYGRVKLLPLHSGAGWMFFAPATTMLYHAPDVASAIWVGIPLLILGYWAGRRARRKARRAGDAFRLTGTAGEILGTLPAFAGLIIVGLAVISFVFGLSIPGPIVWAGAVVCLGLGMAAGISTALSHDDRAHGLSRPGAAGPPSAEPLSAAGG